MQFVYSVNDKIWGTHHWSSKLLLSSFNSSSSITNLSAHSKVFPQERDEAMLQKEEEEEKEENGRNKGYRTDSQAGTGMVVVLWKCSSHYSAFHWGTTPLSHSLSPILLHIINHHICSLLEEMPQSLVVVGKQQEQHRINSFFGFFFFFYCAAAL